MQHKDFITRYTSEQPLFHAWGAFVTSEIKKGLSTKLGSEARCQYFLRLPPIHRTKAVDSLIEKAYYRGKGYASPYEDVTDKVGARFVVLLLKDISIVEEVVNECQYWTASKDRDFEQEREKNPTLFDYQSVHYVVRSARDLPCGTTVVPAQTPCEIQIRTLMQHAFSELTHDTIYKPRALATPKVLRAVAKSMALIEMADQLFQEVSMSINNASSQTDELISALEHLYRDVVGTQPATNARANSFLLDALQTEWQGIDPQNVRDFAAQYPISRWVGARAENDFLFRQPAIFLVYYLAKTKRLRLREQWPYTINELEPIYTDLGQSIGET